jgi:hypothetical protein
MTSNGFLATELKRLLAKGLITEEDCQRMAKAWGIEGSVLDANKQKLEVEV